MKESPLRVLVVEDEALIRWSIAETLLQHGHAVVEADSAATAVEALHDEPRPIDVVLLDLRLPDSSDLGLLANIRRLRPEAALVMMTAHGSREMAREALQLGAYRMLDKPFDMQALEHLLREAQHAHVSTPPPSRAH